MQIIRSRSLVYAAWALITILFATVAKFATGIAWLSSVGLALLTGVIGCLISIFMCWWTDRQGISRLNLIIFCGVGLVFVLLIPAAKGGSFDPTGMKMLLFTCAGLVLTSFFLPKSNPSPATAEEKK